MQVFGAVNLNWEDSEGGGCFGLWRSREMSFHEFKLLKLEFIDGDLPVLGADRLGS
jgi:hypothetical protein